MTLLYRHTHGINTGLFHNLDEYDADTCYLQLNIFRLSITLLWSR